MGIGLTSGGASTSSSAAQSAVSATERSEPKIQNAALHSFGDYELLEEIARGGMGIVYKARQISLNRIVAVKMLLFGQFSSDEFVKRFRAEAEAVASLQHPHIVAIHEIGEHEGQQYFSMDYIEGSNLAELVREKPLVPRQAAALLKTVAEALHYAHGHGILHRDLKPSNVLIDASNQPHVTDFGLAKRLTSNADLGLAAAHLTTAGQIIGTPNYIPPEQTAANAGQVGPASDVYSLGAIFYHLLTGRPLFLADSLQNTLFQVLNKQPVAPRLLNPAVPRDLETICLKCVEKNPQRRYASAQALADDLGRFLGQEPIAARPASTPERLWRWCRRKPGIASLAAAVFLLLLAITSVSILAAIHFQRMREEARQNLYVADMNVALSELREGNTAQAFQLLKRHIPTGLQRDLRGFEWRYLWRLCRGNYSQWLPKHKQVAGAMQFSPDGNLLAVYCWNDTLNVWSLATRQNLFTAQGVTGFGGFTPEGHSLAFGLQDGSLQFWRPEHGVTNSALNEAGDLVGFSPQGPAAVIITRDDTLKVFDLASMQLRLTIPRVSARKLDFGWGDGVTISRDGQWLAVVEPKGNPLSRGQSIRLWNIPAQKELAPLLISGKARSFEFSPEGRYLAVGDGDGNVSLLNLASHESQFFKAHTFPVSSLAFSLDGQTLATGSSDETSIRVWEVASLLPKSNTFPGQIGDVSSLAFSPDGKYLASGARDAPIRIWNLQEAEVGEVVPDRLRSDEYGNFVFSPDSQLMAGGCMDDTVKVWDVGSLRSRVVVTNASYVVCFSKDRTSMLVSTKGGAAHWRSLENQTERPVPRYQGDIHRVLSMDLSPDRRLAALGLPNGSIQLLEIETGKLVGPPLEGHGGPVLSLAFAPGADFLASGGEDKAVMIWNLKTGRGAGICAEHKGAIFGLAISPDGKTLASGCGAGTIKLWDLAAFSTNSMASISYHKSVVTTLAFSPDNKTLASGSEDNTVKLWNPVVQREVASFKHSGHLRLVLFSPDGNALATVTDNGTLRIFRATSLAEADEDWKGSMK